MKYAIISDIHANAAALKNVLSDIAQMDVDSVVCLGDITGYGPLPRETLLIVRNTDIVSVKGNHDDAVAGKSDAEDFTSLAKEAVERHRSALSEDETEYLRSLPYSMELDGDAVAAHGDVTDPEKFYYIESDEDAAENFAVSSARFIFVGHTHTPWIFAVDDSTGELFSAEPSSFAAEDGMRYIVNPGSVGYPREKDGKCHSSYVIFDSVEKTVTYRFLPFSVSSVMQRGTGSGGSERKRAPFVPIVCAAFFIALIPFLFFAFNPSSAPHEGEARSAVQMPPPAPEAENPTVPEEKVFAKRTIRFTGGKKAIKPNLVLDPEKTSDPVFLKIRYRDLKGNVLSVAIFTVRKSIKRTVKLPAAAKDATEAELLVSESRAGGKCAIEKFEPAEVN